MGMNDNMTMQNGIAQNGAPASQAYDFTLKAGLAQMLKGGVIMDVVNAEQVRSEDLKLALILKLILTG